MTRVVITADHAELVSRRLGEAMAAKVRRRAVNAAGKAARKDLPALIAEHYDTSRAAVGPKGRAASPGHADPRYVLTLNRAVAVGKLKARSRRFQLKHGGRLGLLRIKQPSGHTFFRAMKGENKGEFVLPENRFRARKARKLGGVPISLRRGEIGKRREQIAVDLGNALMREMEAALSKRGRG